MAAKGYDLWVERFDREIGIKSSVIVFGQIISLFLRKRIGIPKKVVRIIQYKSRLSGIIQFLRTILLMRWKDFR